MARAIVLALAALAAAVVAIYALGPVWRPDAPRAAVVAGKAVYQCAMHPQIVSSEPGTCPICQMKLQRVDEPASAAEAGGVPGHAPFSLSTERQQLIGVTRGKVERRALDVAIRAVGRIAYDPALYQAVVEYREALRSRTQVARGALGDAHDGADAIVRGARLKLRQQGLSEEQIRDLAGRSGDPVELLLPGESVWVYAQVYEHEIALVAPGQPMTVTSPAYPGRTFAAKVVAIDPIVDAATRTVRVRGLVSSAGATLRPESFVEVRIDVALGEKVAVPEDAVLDTGKHQIAFVVEGEGRFEPRAIALGRHAGGYVEVLSGLDVGDEVVTSANFLIDSESRFRSALASFQSAAAPPPSAAPRQP
jgi:Cu(I)/Ag(I) efflux system membrane fusion protein